MRRRSLRRQLGCPTDRKPQKDPRLGTYLDRDIA
jgi:hypothetical protein